MVHRHDVVAAGFACSVTAFRGEKFSAPTPHTGQI